MVITEIGGTVGDIESQPFLEAIRQFSLDVGKRELPLYPPDARALSESGRRAEDQADAALGRPAAANRYPARHSDLPHRTADRAAKTAKRSPCSATCRIEAVIEERDKDFSIYEVPLSLVDNGLDELIVENLGLTAGTLDLDDWRDLLHTLAESASTRSPSPWSASMPSIATLIRSIYEALDHAGIAHHAQIRIQRIQAELVEVEGPERLLSGYDGLLVPGGFGERGIEGKVEAIRFARERKIPFFGICLGMQCAVIEFARNVIGLGGAHSTEFNKDTPHPVICLLDEQRTIIEQGGHDAVGGPAGHARSDDQSRGRLTARRRFPSGTATVTSSTTFTAISSWPTD